MSNYETSANTRKVKRYRLRKRLKDEGYSEEEIAQELALLDEELGYEESEPAPRSPRRSRAPGQGDTEEEESESESGGSWVWGALGIAGAILYGIVIGVNQMRGPGKGPQERGA